MFLVVLLMRDLELLTSLVYIQNICYNKMEKITLTVVCVIDGLTFQRHRLSAKFHHIAHAQSAVT